MPFPGEKAMILIPRNRQKRNQLFMALAVTLILIAGIAFGIIRPQYLKLADIKKKTIDTQAHLATYKQIIAKSTGASSELAITTTNLANEEQDMATGDIYAWTIDLVRHFKANYRVDVPEIGQPNVSEMDLLPGFPYKQLQFTLRGTGYYHDVGRFIADFENKHPHMRIVNLDLDLIGADTEKLSFRMDIIALVNPAS
jgi:hypothetical protein